MATTQTIGLDIPRFDVVWKHHLNGKVAIAFDDGSVTVEQEHCPDCFRMNGGHQPDCIWADPEIVGKKEG